MSNAEQTVIGHPFDRSLRLEGFDPCQKLAKRQAHLHAREAGPEADVDAEAEGHVAVRRAGDVEPEWVVEYGFVAIGRHLPVGDLIAGLDAMALVAHVARCGAALVDGRRGPAQD